MGYFNDFFKALFVKLGQKYADNYGSATNTVVPLLNQSDMSAKGAMSVQDFALVLGAQQTEIVENADLNNYTTTGAYNCPTNNTARTIANAPVTSAFSMFVLPYFSSGRLIQLLFAAPGVFFRFKVANGWAETWTQIATV